MILYNRNTAFLSAIVLCSMVLSPALTLAKVTSKTKITYYNIKGGSAAGLYKQMAARGPHVAGARAFASTGATQRYNGDFLIRNNRCRIKNFRVKMQFTMSLPKLSSRHKLNSRTRHQWSKFAKFVRRHENRHRSIWLGCAREADRAVRKVSARTCVEAEKKVVAIFKRADKKCDSLHDAFDIRERGPLGASPLIIAAQKRSSKTRKRAIRPSLHSRRFKRDTSSLR